MSDEPIRQPETVLSGFDDSGGPLSENTEEYRAVCGLAVTGFLLGVLAAGATIWPLFWVVPPLGILASAVALRRIAYNAPVLVGRRLALAGLLLSVFFSALVPADHVAYRWAIRRQGRQFAAMWFDCLRHDRPLSAYQLSLDPRYRRPMAQVIQDTGVAGSDARAGLEKYVKKREVRCLLALGDRARVRHYATEGQYHSIGRETTIEVYAVTFEQQGKRKTFFIRLSLDRYDLPGGGGSDWQVTGSEGGYRPKALSGTGMLGSG